MNLNDAIEFSSYYHKEQTNPREINKILCPYIAHCMNVMYKVWHWGTNELIMISAVLHDILEDTVCDYDKLKFIFGEIITNIVQELTFDGKDKKLYLESFKNSSIEALIIKLADRFDNINDRILSGHDAKLYFFEAKPLFEAFFARQEEIIKLFGHRTWQSITMEHISLTTKFGLPI